MTQNYGLTIALSCFSLIILCILVYENARFTIETKRKFYATYIVIILAAIAEFLGFYLDGAAEWTIALHSYAKCADFILSPLIAVFFVRQIYNMTNWLRMMYALLGLNTLFELASIFTGWTFYIDSNNVYHHGPLYMIYMIIYLLCIITVIGGFYAYGTKFKRKNWSSIFLIGVLVAVGVCMQELFNYNIRTCILSLTLAAILQFIHFSEFWQQRSDEDILNHKMLLEKDALTGMMTRYAYNQMLEFYEGNHSLQKNHVVVSIDVNGLKTTNDKYGHAAGDEMIKGAAECVLKAFSPYGKVFRTGGDEFVAVIIADDTTLADIKSNLDALIDRWSGDLVDSLSLSCGYVRKSEYPEASLNELLLTADKRMYSAKSSYYRSKGVDRRSQRAAYDALCNSYAKILKVNLTDDSYDIINVDESELSLSKGFSHTISNWLQNFADTNQIYEEDREYFIANTQMSALRQYFKENDYKCLRYRRYYSGGLTTVLLEMVKAESYSEEHEQIFLYVKNINTL